jgi:phosphoribosylcarboxyaminoimidazole (NCAIR) mutase
MYESPSRYNVTVTVSRDDGELPDLITFAVAADEAAWRRSASIVSAHTSDAIINIVTVHAPDRHAAVIIARAVVSDALSRCCAQDRSPVGPGPTAGPPSEVSLAPTPS